MQITPSERNALLWLSVIILLGIGSKAARQWRFSGADTPASRESLKLHLAVVDSARRADGASARQGRSSAGSARGASAGSRRRSRGRTVAEGEADPAFLAYNGSAVMGTITKQMEQPTLPLVDVDVADITTLERLPRIGPALAARIVVDRADHGPFGSIEGLQRVRGVGPKLAELLRTRVTFSGAPRLLRVQR
jgi:DNA uptake protein ComE-like DNA-binding protein